MSVDSATDLGSEGVLKWAGGSTWYRTVGDLTGGPAPVVVCHGGPGLTHDYLLSLAALAAGGRACVFYDQLGNGRSDHRPDAADGFWTVPLFLTELRALLTHLGITDRYHLLGHSWGGLLALELATERPAGLRSLVLADSFAAGETYRAEVGRLRDELPDAVRAALAGPPDDPGYAEAVSAFYARHVCRMRPVPDEVLRTLGAVREDPRVYETMAGGNEFDLRGHLADWDIRDRLGRVAVPALLISGRYDEVTPAAVAELHHGLSSSRWELFEESSHMPHVEEPEHFRATVDAFLAGIDAADGRPATSDHVRSAVR
ncbi:proline iminopeptidase-family hydrolase [Micromonospora sp. WMMA1363]|uniref:proline iminopeptidase-family hydrolase n=1 Tax=Micromonospora sp. WMMA1363 TaxID=3053985 RepID=UPI00259D0734|nr:proline iminopeptidase-family hydrolase [Micromonospora sp. WMMA1363]MDM4722819.1 proline iminopeptidase-family hydrolase [Micromonospora sp. WMMA1363]